MKELNWLIQNLIDMGLINKEKLEQAKKLHDDRVKQEEKKLFEERVRKEHINDFPNGMDAVDEEMERRHSIYGEGVVLTSSSSKTSSQWIQEKSVAGRGEPLRPTCDIWHRNPYLDE